MAARPARGAAEHPGGDDRFDARVVEVRCWSRGSRARDRRRASPTRRRGTSASALARAPTLAASSIGVILRESGSRARRWRGSVRSSARPGRSGPRLGTWRRSVERATSDSQVCTPISSATGPSALSGASSSARSSDAGGMPGRRGITSGRSGEGVDRAEDRGGAPFVETCFHHRREPCPVVARPSDGLVGERRQLPLGVLEVAATGDRGTKPVDRVVELIDRPRCRVRSSRPLVAIHAATGARADAAARDRVDAMGRRRARGARPSSRCSCGSPR